MQLLTSSLLAQHNTVPLSKQKVDLSGENVTRGDLFKQIQKQTNASINVSRELVDLSKLFTIDRIGIPLDTALYILLKGENVNWELKEKKINILHADTPIGGTMPAMPASVIESIIVTGQVVNNNNESLPGATIRLKHNDKIGCKTDVHGKFTLSADVPDPILLVSYTGYETKEVRVYSSGKIRVELQLCQMNLNEKVAIAYGTTSRKLATGNVTEIKAVEIERAPVIDPMLAIQGRVPGMAITPSSGVTGASPRILIRGESSLLGNSYPLVIIDGIPFAADGGPVNELNSIATQNEYGGISAFSSLDPADIESIVILKDADATAIYGSRGANGVILITTKRARINHPSAIAYYRGGWSYVSTWLPFLATPDYLKMRKEAFKNDGLTPGEDDNAADLTLWDQTRDTDWQDLMIGGTAAMNEAKLTCSVADSNIQFLFGAGDKSITSVFPGKFRYQIGTLNGSLSINSKDKKFQTNITVNYSTDTNYLFNSSFDFLFLPRNAPLVYKKNGDLNWEENGARFPNPIAATFCKYTISKNNMTGNFTLSYNLWNRLRLRSNIGYNRMFIRENLQTPKLSQDPEFTDAQAGTSTFAIKKLKSCIVEPQIEYNRDLLGGRLTVLTGATYQYSSSNTVTTQASGYASDALLGSLNAADTTTNLPPDYNLYKYGGIFTRVTYNFKDRYIINLTGRRDGSSRFLSSLRYENFWSVGAAWIFSDIQFIKQLIPMLSFGKLRSSFGITGNDQFGNHKFVATWSSLRVGSYNNISALGPDALDNPDIRWETNKKFEAAVDLGFFEDKIFTSIAYYRNRSNNQLINYRLPYQTGFGSVPRNFDALIQNSGLEILITGNLPKTGNFGLTASLNLTIPRNKLLRFDNLSTSSYNGIYVVGKSTKVLNILEAQGIDSTAGTFNIKDIDGKPGFTAADFKPIYNRDPTYFWGLQLGFTYRGFELNILGEFRRQVLPNYRNVIYRNNMLPGMKYNQLSHIMNRWQQPGDISENPMFSTNSAGSAYTDRNYIATSSAVYDYTWYLICRNITASYTFNKLWSPGSTLRLFCNAQNLFSITNYDGGNPEVANARALATLTTVTLGVSLTL
ncbi:SusC/RagA family TonB-linked outer membrane protein [Chitinophaga sp. S165]|uniref:SusC/RagA family TonB-linked outer membrane protein n=1 Tax=Chitinophaga sp. S165 TaxID=2135462 RepID=UPI001304CE6D|nr:SusC/RagA family TonB-linked outer membrane protein [Chitinophaga sp. S165]